jgi:nitrite reductase/ring-hydroxylating ferredoxin subunit
MAARSIKILNVGRHGYALWDPMSGAGMTNIKNNRLWVASTEQIAERAYIRIECVYRGKECSILLFRFDGRCMAYINQCVHMPFRLDCEKDMIFDHTGNKLKCSMHGIVYDPVSGESLSPTLCTGEKLTPVKVVETDEGIWITDKRITAVVK